MPYSEIKSCSVHRTCGKYNGESHTFVKIQAVRDSSQHIFIGLNDADSFVALVNAMMKRETNELSLKAEVVDQDKQVSMPLL